MSDTPSGRVGPSTRAQSAVQRAMQAFNQQPLPVQNASKVAPEEMGAITSTSAPQEEEQTPLAAIAESAEAGQSDINESTASSELAQEPVKEASPQETKPSEDTEDPALSSKYAILARKEKALRAKMQAMKAQEDALKAREEAYKAKDQEYQSKYIAKDRLSENPLEVMAEAGYTNDQIANMLLNQNQVSPEVMSVVNSLKAEIKALKDSQEESKRSDQDRQAQAYKQAIAQIKSDATTLVQSDPAYETIKETGSIDDVVDLIEQTYKEDKKVLSVAQAAQMVEDFLVEEALKVAKIKKIQSRLAAAQPAVSQSAIQAAQKGLTSEPKQPQPAKTLTNSISTASRKLTARERAVLAFEGKK